MFFDLKLCGLHACASCQLSQTMSLSKREKASEAGIPLAKRLRSNVGDLFLSNQISAQRAQEIFQDAAYAGASSVKDLTKGLDNPSSEKLQRNVHAARNLRSSLRELLGLSLMWLPFRFGIRRSSNKDGRQFHCFCHMRCWQQ